MGRVREHTLGNATVVMIFVEEVLRQVLVGRHHEKVEVVEDLLLLEFPIIVMEVVIHPHEALIQDLRDD